METPRRCPLCIGRNLREFAVVHERSYWRCANCQLTFLHPDNRLPREEEFARYQEHNNDPDDPEYRAFLSRLTDCLVPHLAPTSEGLDYGSGPGPTISVMLGELGYEVSNYDPFFTQDAALFRTYDFITCTETAEHFYNPAYEFTRLDMLLNATGILALMTGMLYDDSAFGDWWYTKDPTHVAFYREETFRWIAQRYHWRIELPRENVAMFFKDAAEDK